MLQLGQCPPSWNSGLLESLKNHLEGWRVGGREGSSVRLWVVSDVAVSGINGQSSSRTAWPWLALSRASPSWPVMGTHSGSDLGSVCLGNNSGGLWALRVKESFPRVVSVLMWQGSQSLWPSSIRAGPAGPGQCWDAAASGLSYIIFFPLQRGRVWKAPVSPCVWVPVSFPSPFHSQFIQCFFKSHYSWSTARCNRNVTFSHCIYSLQTLCDKLGSPGCSWSFLLCKYNYLTLH